METLKGTRYGDIISTPSMEELKREVRYTGSFFFDYETLRFFGTRNVEVIGGCVVIGLDTKPAHPESPYWARVFSTKGYAEVVAMAPNRPDIVKQALAIAADLRASAGTARP